MGKLDRLGRATFHHIAHQDGVQPTNREIRWLKHLERHGPQSSQFLFEATSDTHRCKDTALRALQRLRAGGFLRLPPQQRQTAKADFNPFIYDLTPKATAYLNAHGFSEPTIRPTGHWWHAFRTSEFTGGLEITARQRGVTYVPGYKILALKHSALPIPLPRGRLIPDQLFALQYPEGFRAFLLEIDRSTEPLTSSRSRKNLAHAIDQYRKVFEQNLPRSHYGLRATTLVLWVFEDPMRQTRFLELLQERAGSVARHFLLKTWPPHARAWSDYERFQTGAWICGDGERVGVV